MESKCSCKLPQAGLQLRRCQIKQEVAGHSIFFEQKYYRKVTVLPLIDRVTNIAPVLKSRIDSSIFPIAALCVKSAC